MMTMLIDSAQAILLSGGNHREICIYSPIQLSTKEDMVEQIFIYLSSHGQFYINGRYLPLGDGKTTEYSFITHDSSSNSIGFQGISALQGEALIKYINDIKAKEKVLFVDTCFCGKIGMPLSKVSGSHVYLLSCGQDQESFVHSPDKISIFTKSVAQGLSGEMMKRGMESTSGITVTALYDYVHPAVKQAAMRIKQRLQEPVLRSYFDDGSIRLV